MARQAKPKQEPKLNQANVHELGADAPIMIGSAEGKGGGAAQGHNTPRGAPLLP